MTTETTAAGAATWGPKTPRCQGFLEEQIVTPSTSVPGWFLQEGTTNPVHKVDEQGGVRDDENEHEHGKVGRSSGRGQQDGHRQAGTIRRGRSSTKAPPAGAGRGGRTRR